MDKPKKTLTLPLKPATENVLEELGRAVEPLFHAAEPHVCRDARSIYRRLLPDVTKNEILLETVPHLVVSLLHSLEILAPKYDLQFRTVETAWAEVERTLTD
jgi:hypothetical protein